MTHAAAIVTFVSALAAQRATATLSVAQPQASQTTSWLGAPPIHAVRGVVSFVSADRLVLTSLGKATRTITFVLLPSTPPPGPLVIGATVSVRYRVEGTRLIAMAVTPRIDARAHTSAPVVK